MNCFCAPVYILLFLLPVLSNAQSTIVQIQNPSLEGTPQSGIEGSKFELTGWRNCSETNDTPVDIHGRESRIFGNAMQPKHGNTYVGMVIRPDKSYECLQQELWKPLLEGKNYSLTVDLARADVYKSMTSGSVNEYFEDYFEKNDPVLNAGEIRLSNISRINFVAPVIMQMWGETADGSHLVLLAESPIVDHNYWKSYELIITPSENVHSILLTVKSPYPEEIEPAGNILIDNFSNIKELSNEEFGSKNKMEPPSQEWTGLGAETKANLFDKIKNLYKVEIDFSDLPFYAFQSKILRVLIVHDLINKIKEQDLKFLKDYRADQFYAVVQQTLEDMNMMNTSEELSIHIPSSKSFTKSFRLINKKANYPAFKQSMLEAVQKDNFEKKSLDYISTHRNKVMYELMFWEKAIKNN